jgi:acetoin utilization protein AcuB
MYVKDLMTPGVVAVRPSDTLAVAREQLRQHRIHHLVVMENGGVVGLLSYRDLIGKGDTDAVGEIMSRDVVTVQPWETARNAASKMIGRTHGCLPVIDGDRVAGIITSTDLLHAVSQPRTA